ncbi:ser/Thr protein phosphatase superfamily [Nemania sp. NC0429]|nr:ser/Thr protein phosphatase superfamily [Nemania sp. NC0429]
MDIIRAIGKRLQRLSNPRIQVLSDLHLEIGQQYTSYSFPTSAPLLLLAGDIGRLIDYDGYLHFLNAQVLRYRKVFLVLGNHEFYGLDYDAGLKQAQRLAAEPSLAAGLILLHKAQWNDPESSLTILGCTLWSMIPEDRHDLVKSKISDFRMIGEWTPLRHNQVHAEEASWLREQVIQLMSRVQNGADRQLLVATHHAPCTEGTSKPEHSANLWTPAFATDLIHQESWRGVKTWVFGHTHYSTTFRRNGIRLVANQRGYVFPNSKAMGNEGKTKKTRHEFDAARFVSI